MNKLMPLKKFETNISNLYQLDNKGVHNFSVTTLVTYFYLNEMLASKTPPLLLKNSVLVLPNKQGRFKTFVYQEPENSKNMLEYLRSLGPVYSIDKLQQLDDGKPFVEIAYDLEQVNNPASYKNAKKRHQRLTYPITQLEKWGVSVESLSKENFAGVQELHDMWVDYKLADPKIFKIMFPNKKYLFCCQKALQYPRLFKTFVFKFGGKVLATRIVGIDQRRTYDLANFGNSWDSFSQLMNYADTLALKNLYVQGFKSLNCGFGLNKNLTAFKEHYPNYEVTSYIYSQAGEDQ